MFELLIGSLKAGITLLAEREKNLPLKTHLKFQKRLNELEEQWLREYDREEATQSDAVLDTLERDIMQLARDYQAAVLGIPKV